MLGIYIALSRLEIGNLLLECINPVVRLAKQMIEDFDGISALIQNIVYLIRIISFFEQAMHIEFASPNFFCSEHGAFFIRGS